MSTATMMNNTNSRAQGQAPTLSLHDPEFKNLITVPLSAVHHLPPAHLEISRLVLCRKYDPRNPTESCPMGESCKFVHIDMATPELQVQSIHVNYAYRSLEEVPHERLPAGEQVAVMAPNGRAPSQLVPSEMILKTRGAENRNSGKPVSHCAHYFYNRMCNRGERCSFLHCLFIDPTAADFQRAPPRAGASVAAKPQHHACCASHAAAPAPLAHHRPQQGLAAVPQIAHLKAPSMLMRSPSSGAGSSCDLSESPRSQNEELLSSCGSQRSFSTTTKTAQKYRHNPYSLFEATTIVA
jgi:hypothetical protein